jgi:hypothetical protein
VVAEVNHTLAASSEERTRDADLRRYAEQLETLGIQLDGAAEIATKGFMIIGTFRKTPLDSRKEHSFPDQLLRPLNRSSICALTDLQLFCMVLDARRNQGLKEKFANTLFSTNGVYSEHNDQSCWRDHLTDAVVEESGGD